MPLIRNRDCCSICQFGSDFVVAEAEEGLWVLGDNGKGQPGLGHTSSTRKEASSPLETTVMANTRSSSLSKGAFALLDSTTKANSVSVTGRPHRKQWRSSGMVRSLFRWTGGGFTPSFLMRKAVCGKLVAAGPPLVLLPFKEYQNYL